MVAAPLVLLALIAAAILLDGGQPGTPSRHLYLLPTLWAALASGARGGTLVGLVAGLLQAPLVLPAIERVGLSSATLDGLVSLVTPLAFGGLLGRLRDQAAARGLWLAAMMASQRSLMPEGALDERLTSVCQTMRSALGADRAALVVGMEPAAAVVGRAPPGADRLGERSAVAWTLRTGRTIEAGDLDGDPRFSRGPGGGPTPRRGLVLPLAAGEARLGALALEWSGELPARTRQAAAEMAVHLGLGIENVRLMLRQRQFAAELEAKVAEATGRLRALDRAKSEFLSVVSHELRTPLTALQGFSELLLTRAVPPERATRFLGHLHSEAQRLGRIVGELLDLARIESGRAESLRRDPVDLDALVERNVELFASSHRGHRFAWQSGGGGPVVTGDPDALDRIVKNLLSNAVKYSPRGGQVRVRVGTAAGRPGMVELAVEDEGVGIAAEALPRVFDRYVRLCHPETAAVRGLGLGLSLVRALAEAHGGGVGVESQPGKGSRFLVRLPVATARFLPGFPPGSP